MLNLDTHILIDLMIGHLNPKEDKLVRQQNWCISDIVLWEIFKLNQLGRIEIDLNHPEIRQFFKSLVIFPIDMEILTAMSQLDFKSDPADEIIASTSLAHRIPLLTRDQKIKKSRKVPLAIK